MTDKIELIRKTIELSKSSMNEADTRFKIIDTILVDICDWPKENSFLEVVHEEGTKSDYILKGKSGKPLLVIEAKNNQIEFNLPKSVKPDKLSKIKVKELLTDKNIKEATLQCKEYCEEIGCDFGCISNGKIWIFYFFRPSGLPWKTLSASVISDLSYFLNSYSEAYNFLGFESVSQFGSIKTTVGSIKSKNDELFYPKTKLISYDMPVNKNMFSSVFTNISKLYFDDINVEDYEFMESCYVTNRNYFKSLNEGIFSFVSDSITPYFKTQGFKEIEDETHSSEFGKKIRKFSTNTKKNALMILFGGRGAGKSTFLKKFLYHDPPNLIKNNSVISIIDLLNCAQDSTGLANEIWETLSKRLDFNNLLTKGREELLLLFNRDYKIFHKQFLVGLKVDDFEYHRLVSDFLTKCLNDKKLICESFSHYWKRQEKGIIIVLDNLDQLRPELQDICFLTSVEISTKLDCLVITSMREERFYSVKNRGVLDAYHNNGFHLPSPIISYVIKRRITFLLKKIDESKDPLEEFSIENQLMLDEIKIVLNVLLRNLSNSNSELKVFLENVTHGDVRMALNYFKNFISSGYTNVDEISKKPYWTFSHHQVLKPMMIPERFFYDEKLSYIPNLFQIRDPSNGSHFTGIRLLKLINSYSGDDKNSGFIDVKHVIQEIENIYNNGFEAEKILDIFLNKTLIESSNRLESYSHLVDQVRLTSFGRYMLNDLMKRFVYLELVSIETGYVDSKLTEIIRAKAQLEVQYFYSGDYISRLNCRIERAELFLKYLQEQEEIELRDLSIENYKSKIIPDFVTYFEEEKKIILKSAKRKFEKEIPEI